ncbi:MAG: hypothetical protein JST32_04640 [Bacteroidetes bacterium]|nr:hypothetical protein [Bacteroidota bacterium]
MKSLKLSIAALLLLGAFSCKKDNSPAVSASVTTDQAADLAAGSLSSNSLGIASMTDAVSSNAVAVTSLSAGGQTTNSLGIKSIRQACGTTLTDSTTFSGSSDSVSFDYFAKYTHTLNCNANEQPDNIVNTLLFHGSYDGPNISKIDSGSANVTIAGLTSAASNFVINGEYKRSGSYTSKVGNKGSGNSSIDIVLTNVTLTKPGRKISGGTATISISGTSAKGSFSYTGTITFNGDNTCWLNIGKVRYLIDLHTGFRIRK